MIQLLLGLLESQPHSLLVELPEITPNRFIDQLQLFQLIGHRANARAKLAVLVDNIVNTLIEPVDSLFLGLAYLCDLPISHRSDIINPIDEHVMPLDGLLIHFHDFLLDIDIDFSKFFQRGVDVHNRPSRFIDQVERMGDVGSQLVQP